MEVDRCLDEMHSFGVGQLTAVAADQRISAERSMADLLEEAKKNMREHAIRALNPRNSAQKSSTEMLEEVKSLMGRVGAVLTGGLDQMDAGIERYAVEFKSEGRRVLQAFVDAQAEKHGSRAGRNEEKSSRKIELLRKAAAAEVTKKVADLVMQATIDHKKMQCAPTSPCAPAGSAAFPQVDLTRGWRVAAARLSSELAAATDELAEVNERMESAEGTLAVSAHPAGSLGSADRPQGSHGSMYRRRRVRCRTSESGYCRRSLRF